MLKMNGRGELTFVKPGKDVRDDKVVKTVHVKLDFVAVPLDVVERGFISQLSLFYSKDSELKIDGIEYLPPSRHVSNVRADIGGVAFEPAIVKNVRIVPRPGRVCDVHLELVGDIVSGLDALHDLLKTTVTVDLEEREFQVAVDDQRAAA